MSDTDLTCDEVLSAFKTLTRAQKNGMNHVAFSSYATDVMPTKKTLQSLHAMKLIDKHVRVIGGGEFSVTVDDYSMPIPIHYLWCDQVSEDDE